MRPRPVVVGISLQHRALPACIRGDVVRACRGHRVHAFGLNRGAERDGDGLDLEVGGGGGYCRRYLRLEPRQSWTVGVVEEPSAGRILDQPGAESVGDCGIERVEWKPRYDAHRTAGLYTGTDHRILD